jgi:hypothetical protein
MQFYRGGSSGGQGVTGFGADTGGTGGYSVGSSGSSATSDTGKYNIDITNPAGSTIPGLDVLGGIAGAIGNVGIPFVPGSTVKNVLGTAGDVVGGAGDIGVGGFGVKQAVGVAGDVLAAPQKYVQTQFAKGRISTAQQYRAAQKAGVQLPAGFAEGAALPQDLQDQLDAGVSVEHVANELADRNAGFTSNPLFNTLDSIIMDPMNLVSFGAGKALSLGARAGATVQLLNDAQKAGRTAEDVGVLTRVMGATYNGLTSGLSRAGAVQAERMIGPVTSGVVRAHPDALPMIEKLASVDSGAGGQLADAFARSNMQIAGAIWGKQLALRFKAGTGLVMDAAQRAGMAKEWIGNQIKLGKKAFEDASYDLALAKRVTPAATDTETLTNEATTMIARASGASEDVVRAQLFPKGATVQEWQAARQMQYGAAVADALKLPAVDAAAVAAGRRVTLVAADTMDEATGKGLIQELAAAGSKSGKVTREVKAATNAVDTLGRPLPQVAPVDQLEDVLGPATVQAGATATVEAGTATAPEIARRILRDYPEIASDLRSAARAAGKTTYTASWKDVQTYLKVHLPEMPTVLAEPITGKNALPAAFGAFREKWAADGYRLGFEPKLGWKVADTGAGLYEPVRPFVPMLGDSLAVTQRNALGRVYDGLMGGITQTRIIAEAQDRLVVSLAKYDISTQETHAVMRSILNAASDARLTPRSMYEKFDKVFSDVLGTVRYAKLKNEGFSAPWAVNHAFEGNIQTVGLTQKATGIVKTLGATKMGNYPVKIAEGLYPKLKFNWNPMFGSQEVIESPFFNVLRGINPWRTGDITKEFDTLYSVMQKNQIARNVFEAGYATFAAGQEATQQVLGVASRRGQIFDKLFPAMRTGGLSGFKQKQAALQAFRTLPEEFKSAIQEIAPDAWKAMETSYKTTDAAVIAQKFAEERFALAESQRALGFEMDAVKAAGKAPDVATETMQQAFEWALKKASDQAYKTQFFNPSRGWLERTLNHPYLGLYPLSYMWGKVVPEFSRFLFAHPFGLDAPMLGYDAAQHVRNTMLVQMQDPEFAKQMEDNKGAIYMIQLLLPATPENIPVNAPAWARHLADAQAKGKKFNVATEATGTIQNIGVLRLPGTLNSGLSGALGGVTSGLAGALGGITDQLDNAAALYDGNVNQP